MHIQINAKYLKEFYRKYDVNRNGTIEKEEFECFIQDLMEKEELKSLFRKYHKDTEGQGMSFFSLQEFFEREQHQKFTIQEIQNVA
jgi:Ca2+-binding EF-hand superfamily protein